MVQQKTKLVERFDKDGDKRLNAAERKAAREYLAQQGGGRRFGFRGRGPGGWGQSSEIPKAGAKLTPADVKSFPDAPLYDPQTLRTLFLDFQDSDWEKELAEFKGTDVEVPAKLTVDGKTYQEVGVHFRGMSSFMMVGEGRKRSMSLSLDYAHKDQQLGGYRTLHLLNAHEDPSFLRSVLSYQIDRDYVPAPKANFVRVVINRESWGIYVNVQHYNKDFVRDWFGTTKGARWKVPGSPGGQGSLAYLGDDPAAYKRIYEIKTKDEPKAWADLARLCKVLTETPAESLEQALAPVLDVDGALKFLALENVLVNNDGYWIRSSDYNIYEDVNGRFHILPEDSNETFSRPEGMGFGAGRGGGRGFRGGAGGFGPGMLQVQPMAPQADKNALPQPPFANRGGGAGGGRRFGGQGFGGPQGSQNGQLDPLVSAKDPSKPFASKLLAVPALRARYLAYVHDIAEKWLDWNRLGPIAEQYHNLIAADVQADERKLDSTEDFLNSLGGSGIGSGAGGFGRRISLKTFADERRAYLAKYPEIKKLSGENGLNSK